jgi:hypothetical protein
MKTSRPPPAGPLSSPSNAAPSPPSRWAYTYLITPPQPRTSLAAIRRMLAREHADARRRHTTWAARLVAEPMVTGILVVSDSPSRAQPINQRVETALRSIPAGFAVSAPVLLEPLEPEAPASASSEDDRTPTIASDPG